jgi:hypothetical protein
MWPRPSRPLPRRPGPRRARRRPQVITAFALVAPGRLSVRQRTLLYLEPRDTLYFSARGRAVAVYDYSQAWARVAAPQGATACVETPKDVVQCI